MAIFSAPPTEQQTFTGNLIRHTAKEADELPPLALTRVDCPAVARTKHQGLQNLLACIGKSQSRKSKESKVRACLARHASNQSSTELRARTEALADGSRSSRLSLTASRWASGVQAGGTRGAATRAAKNLSAADPKKAGRAPSKPSSQGSHAHASVPFPQGSPRPGPGRPQAPHAHSQAKLSLFLSLSPSLSRSLAPTPSLSIPPSSPPSLPSFHFLPSSLSLSPPPSLPPSL